MSTQNSFLGIGAMAAQCGISAHTLRYYERAGLIHAVARDDGGRRRYAAADVTWIRFLLRLRETGMPIREMHRYAELRAAGDSTLTARREMLEQHREVVAANIASLQENLAALDVKLVIYREQETALGSPVLKLSGAHHERTLSTGLGQTEGNRRRSR